MRGFARSTIPSLNSNTRRRNPCAAGWCGPKLIVKSWIFFLNSLFY